MRRRRLRSTVTARTRVDRKLCREVCVQYNVWGLAILHLLVSYEVMIEQKMIEKYLGKPQDKFD